MASQQKKGVSFISLQNNRKQELFGDNDINFDLQLEKWDDDRSALKELEVMRIFCAWVEGWEEEIRLTNDCIAEVKLLQKYRDLVLYDTNYHQTFVICCSNMEYHCSKKIGDSMC
jgi:hypothetical protein